MPWFRSFLSRFASASQWRDIATAPFGRVVELAVIDGKIGVLPLLFVRHGGDWLDAETLQPVSMTATHWRFARSVVHPTSCC